MMKTGTVLLMDDWCSILDRMLSVSMESREMSRAEDALVLAPLYGDIKPGDFDEALPSDMVLQENKSVPIPVLSLCHFLGSLARLGLGEFSIASP